MTGRRDVVRSMRGGTTKEVGSQTPLAAIRIDEKTFLVIEEHGYEDTEISVYEVESDQLRQVLTVGQGGC